MKKFSIGIDIGGTNSAIGIVDEDGNVLVKGTIDTPSHGEIDRFVKSIGTAVRDMAKKVKLTNPDSEILGMGIGAPNGNYYNGTIEYAPIYHLRGWFVWWIY
ncbi:ROK family protein [Geofilum rubicundum]|uniref:Glucokinase n=1 Tax=Geofilum rubicundum JCM 15548 TaxID=1236989 RepID=A0A0E9LPT5_9BACT|nr:ROK family protein [Geofilum rubicundum]GAO27602.1 glucokinase [Geofilum rubicundum JCM 15548]